MFHEMTQKLYFMKCLERNISQCILPLRAPCLQNTSGRLLLYLQYAENYRICYQGYDLDTTSEGPTCIHHGTN